MSKGSQARPFSVDHQTFGSNWDATFRGVAERSKASASKAEQIVGSNPTSSATSHSAALIRLGEDGKITYAGSQESIRCLILLLKAKHED